MKTSNKNYLATVLVLLGLADITMAQTAPSAEPEIIKRSSIGLLNIIKINNSELRSHDLILDPKLIEHSESKGVNGNFKNGVIFSITVKPGVQLINLTQIFDKYKIDSRYRNYPVIVDRAETQEAKTLLADPGSIEKVTVNKQEKYIEIVTIFYNRTMSLRKEAADSKRDQRIQYEKQRSN